MIAGRGHVDGDGDDVAGKECDSGARDGGGGSGMGWGIG